MKLVQMTKRVLLFVMVNLLVVTTISVILGFLGVGRYFSHGGLGGLAVICLIWGFVGAFISLAMSRMMAKWMMGVQIIPPDTNHPELRRLVETVHELAQRARLPEMPEVGIYDSQEVNAFATGPSKSRALVAVSTGLLNRMSPREVVGVLGHEIAHVANGDMVTMTLIQGVINAFVMFLSHILAFAISQAMRSRNEDDDRPVGGGILEFVLIQVFSIVFSILGMFVTSWFSRQREYRADAGGAEYAGRDNMINALKSLQRCYDPEIQAAEASRGQAFQSMKISGKQGGIMALLSTHPDLGDRIQRLEQGF